MKHCAGCTCILLMTIRKLSFFSMNWTESDRIRIEIFLSIPPLTWNRSRGTCGLCSRFFKSNVQQKILHVALQARSKLRTSWLFNFYERSRSLMKLGEIFSSRLENTSHSAMLEITESLPRNSEKSINNQHHRPKRRWLISSKSRNFGN
jgi:hypothetical protein